MNLSEAFEISKKAKAVKELYKKTAKKILMERYSKGIYWWDNVWVGKEGITLKFCVVKGDSNYKYKIKVTAEEIEKYLEEN